MSALPRRQPPLHFVHRDNPFRIFNQRRQPDDDDDNLDSYYFQDHTVQSFSSSDVTEPVRMGRIFTSITQPRNFHLINSVPNRYTHRTSSVYSINTSASPSDVESSTAVSTRRSSPIPEPLINLGNHPNPPHLGKAATEKSYDKSSSSRKTDLLSQAFFRLSSSPERDDEPRTMAAARRMYLKSYLKGILLIICTIFLVFSIYWGSLWEIPVRPLDGIVVDFDGGFIGLNVSLSLIARSSPYIQWTYASASEFGGSHDLAEAVRNERAWVAVSINEGASEGLNSALLRPNYTYNGTLALTAYAVEARSEIAFRNFIRPQATLDLDAVTAEFAAKLAQHLVSNTTSSTNHTGSNPGSASIIPLVTSSELVSLMAISPQTVVRPVSYTINNVLAFRQPVASAATSVGLIYLLILSFFVVITGFNARQRSGLNRDLPLNSLIYLRFLSSFSAYFVISLFYTLLNKVFRLDTSETFGGRGLLVLWMLNWIGMLSVGLALESAVTLLTVRYVPFFMILWIITNVSVCTNPIDVMPSVYKYGYAFPFYHISRSTRTISMGTKNEVSLNFGVLIAWILVSCMTMPVLQWFVRRWKAKRRLARRGRGSDTDTRSRRGSSVSRTRVRSRDIQEEVSITRS